jgi:hypothetical protein
MKDTIRIEKNTPRTKKAKVAKLKFQQPFSNQVVSQTKPQTDVATPQHG